MSTALLIGLVLLVLALIGALALSRSPAGRDRRRHSLDGMAEREAAMEAQAGVEESDIDEMLAARDALRKRIGKQSLADDLEQDARRRLDDG